MLFRRLSTPGAQGRARMISPHLQLLNGGLLEMMKNRCLEGQTIVQASEDPRVGSVTLTLSANPGTLHRPLAAKVGLSALQVYAEAKRVTLRIFVETRLTFVADVTRESLTSVFEKANTTEVGTLSDEQLESALTDLWQPS